MFASVPGIGNAVAELEVEYLEEFVPEVMPLYHAELVDGAGPHGELHSAKGDQS